jgi:hypothetical protein
MMQLPSDSIRSPATSRTKACLSYTALVPLIAQALCEFDGRIWLSLKAEEMDPYAARAIMVADLIRQQADGDYGV